MENTKQPAFTAEVRKSPMSQKGRDALGLGQAPADISWEEGFNHLNRKGYNVTTWKGSDGKWSWSAVDPQGDTINTSEPTDTEEETCEKAITAVAKFAFPPAPAVKSGPIGKEDRDTFVRYARAHKYLSERLPKVETYEELDEIEAEVERMMTSNEKEEVTAIDNSNDIETDKAF